MFPVGAKSPRPSNIKQRELSLRGWADAHMWAGKPARRDEAIRAGFPLAEIDALFSPEKKSFARIEAEDAEHDAPNEQRIGAQRSVSA